MSRWRFAARLAWREVRRRPGRTVLVVLLVLVPVLGMTAASVLIRTLDDDTWFDVAYPEAVDMVVSGDGVPGGLSGRLPDGSSLWTVESAWAPLELADGTVTDQVAFTGLGDEGQLGHRVFDTSGRLPRRGEVWLSRPVLDELGLSIGDSLTLSHPSGTWQVVGAGRSAEDRNGRMVMLADLPDNTFRPDVISRSVLIDLPAAISQGEVDAIARDVPANTRGVGAADDSDAEPLAWGWVIGTIALGATGIIVAAAFATSARRQLVTIGLLSSNGASERVLRRTLALQGTWTALTGSLLGVASGLVALVAGRPLLERLQGHVLPDYRMAPLDLVVIVATGTIVGTLAALLPARSAARVPVMAALAGRRPLGVVPRRLVPTGVGVFALGVVLLAAAAGTDGGGSGPAVVAVIGGLFVLAGTCCCSPLATELMSGASASVGRAWRFAGRSLGRTRTRSAAVVTAIAVATAAAAAGSAGALNIDDESAGGGLDNIVQLAPLRTDPNIIDATGEPLIDPETGYPIEPDPSALGSWPDLPFPVELKERLLGAVDGAMWLPRRIVRVAPMTDELRSGPAEVAWVDTGIVIADERLMDAYRLSDAERSRLSEVGVLSLVHSGGTAVVIDDPLEESDGGLVPAGEQALTIPTADGELVVPFAVRDAESARYELNTWSVSGDWSASWVSDAYLMTPAAAERAGVVVMDNGGWLVTPDAISREEHEQIGRVVFGDSMTLAQAYLDVEPEPSDHPGWAISSRDFGPPVSAEVVQAIILGVALLAVLLVVAIGLSLSATESRDERDVLVAVGARPRTMRSMAGAKAVVMVLSGVAVGVPTGLIPMFFATRAAAAPFHVPWLALAGLLIAIPALAGLAATAASAIAQRFRPVRMSTLAVD